ncbi:MAG: hypothetical protein KC996_11195 [Phycisphaerales bacterium]|nr:hypothetical protein [Phycisphaerales bacterium]
MPRTRTVRRIIQAERPPTGHGGALEHVAEKQILIDPDGGVTELEITQGYACGCSRDREIGLRCLACKRIHCSQCRNIGVTCSSDAYCGNCSRVVRHRDGSTERVPRRGYWKRRMKRYAKACVGGFLSLFIEREDRP